MRILESSTPALSPWIVLLLASSFLVILPTIDFAIVLVEGVDRLPRTAGFGTLCEIGTGLERSRSAVKPS